MGGVGSVVIMIIKALFFSMAKTLAVTAA